MMVKWQDDSGIDREIYVDIPTPDIIAELEKRRPCKKCDYPKDIGNGCALGGCFWHSNPFEDSFKAKEER